MKYVRALIAATVTLGAAATISLATAPVASAQPNLSLCGTCWYSTGE